MRALVITFVLCASTIGHADPIADATKAFNTVIDSLATDKPATDGIDIVLSPYHDYDRVDLDTLKSLLDHPKTKVLRAIVSKSGKSAWIAATVTTKLHRDGKVAADTLRASAFVALDGTTWKIRALQISATKPEKPVPGCGLSNFDWHVDPKVPADITKPIKAVLDALQDYGKTGAFAATMSDDKNALVFGSAPGEVFNGGAAIKAVFKKWSIYSYDAEHDSKTLPVRAAAGPDGEMIWGVFSIASPVELCTGYRAMFILAKESAGWRIVHQHYAPFITKDMY